VRILLSNDDGVHSPGLVALFEGLGGLGVLEVVAPDRDHSGASNALTLSRPLTVEEHPNGFHSVDGTPTDCVHVAVTGLLARRPDLVVSGINNGANMGDDTIYSGTVAAAMEGFQCGLPAIAFSLAGKGYAHLDSAARVAAEIVERFLDNKLGLEHCLLNVNIPPIPYDDMQGYECTRLDKRHHAEPVIPTQNPKDETVYWIGPPGGAKDAGPGTDFYAVKQGKISISPLKADLTHTEQMKTLADWL